MDRHHLLHHRVYRIICSQQVGLRAVEGNLTGQHAEEERVRCECRRMRERRREQAQPEPYAVRIDTGAIDQLLKHHH
ncbi:MAG: hypothetical protein U0R18_20260, partial [Mycobacterium sp.]